MKTSKKNNFDTYTPSWYIYTDEDGKVHDVVYRHDYINEFFADVSKRIAFNDCTGETVQKIFFQGEEVEYAGWQHNMRFEYIDLNYNTIWVGQFEHWDH